METVTLSPDFRVDIPRSICDALNLAVGEKLWVLAYADRVEFVRARPIQEMRGFLRGMNSEIEREE
jgi:hypothetical protein